MRPSLSLVTTALETGEFVAKRKIVGELTWTHRNPDNRVNSKTEMCGDQNAKCAVKQLVPLGHSVYSKENRRIQSQREFVSVRGERPYLNPTVI